MKKLLQTTFLAVILVTGGYSVAYADHVESNSTETTGQYAKASLITAKVKSALLAQKNIDSTKINVQSETVKDDKIIIILTGTQKNKKLINSAVATAKNVDGVTKVINKLTVAE